MTYQEMVKGLTYLGTAYGKEYTKIEIDQHYDFLKSYSYEIFVPTIKNIIGTSKFLPKITEIIDECEKYKKQIKFDIIEFMNKKGYFKNISEYEKTMLFIKNDNVPYWLQKDINEYYKKMVSNEIGYNEQKLIEC